MKKTGLTFLVLFFMFGLMAQTRYLVDKAHSSVNFKVKHNGISFVNGSFNSFEGFIEGNLNSLE
ncbi:MAG: polyisoprenoid-binding protein, partial [Bacteroidales bacterium]|nr:polyisoprenoid-binding protein [Bacteroidales bacterium]